jgi:hypothetical protein
MHRPIRARVRGPRGRLVVATLAVAWLLGASIGPVLAASPAPSAGSDYGGDTRTSGQGPGLVGSPLYAIGGVLVVALVSLGVTMAYVRATTPRPVDAGGGTGASSGADAHGATDPGRRPDEAEQP